jgi:hypothetical protein
LVDTLTGGVAAEPFLKILEPDNLAGVISSAPEGLEPALKMLLDDLGADIVGLVSQTDKSPETGRDSSLDGDIREWSARVRLLRGSGSGGTALEIADAERLLGRPKAVAMTRAGALLALELWKYLKTVG